MFIEGERINKKYGIISKNYVNQALLSTQKITKNMWF